jgi:ribonuclease HI
MGCECAGYFCIYTDGSGKDGAIGAAATIAEEGRRNITRRMRLGEADTHTVLEAEITGIILATDIAYHAPRIRKLAILLDNQSAIAAMSRQQAQSGQHLIREAQHQMGRLGKKHPGIEIKIVWVPGHKGNEGNERANKEARKAAAGDETGMAGLALGKRMQNIPASMTALKATYKRRVMEKWKEKWNGTKQMTRQQKFDKQPPGNHVLKFYKGRTRKECSIITQLRSGHVALNKYLHRIKATDSPNCIRCNQPETVEHYLTKCKRYIEPRKHLRESIKGIFNLTSLLGDHSNTDALLKYVKDTDRLEKQQRE